MTQDVGRCGAGADVGGVVAVGPAGKRPAEADVAVAAVGQVEAPRDRVRRRCGVGQRCGGGVAVKLGERGSQLQSRSTVPVVPQQKWALAACGEQSWAFTPTAAGFGEPNEQSTGGFAPLSSTTVKPGIGTPAALAAATVTTAVGVTAGCEWCPAAAGAEADCCAAGDRVAAAAADVDAAASGSTVGVTPAAGVETAGTLVVPGLSGAAAVHAVSAIAVAAATSTAKSPGGLDASYGCVWWWWWWWISGQCSP